MGWGEGGVNGLMQGRLVFNGKKGERGGRKGVFNGMMVKGKKLGSWQGSSTE